MYIETVPNRNSTPTTLLRESYRQHGKVKKRTLANLTHWPKHLVQDFNLLLKGGTAIADLNTSLTIQRSLPHGAVVAVLGSLKKLGLHRLIDRKNSRHSQLVLAMIVARILEPSSKLATARGLSEIQGEIPANTLVDTLALDKVNEDDLYEAMDWLLEHQPRIEQALAKRHLDEGALVMYDLTSVYMEGRKCELAKRGYSRDGKKGKLQVEFGLLCNADGCPVAVEVYAGNTADPNTVGSQIYKLRERFGLSKVVLVGDRGMLTEARIREEVKPAGLDWISALRGPAIRKLMEAKAVQLSLFDEKDLVEIRHDTYPGERLMVCRNPFLADERARKREELLVATEQILEPIVAATRRRGKQRLVGEDKIGERVGKVIGKYKMAKHFEWSVDEGGHFNYERKTESIATEAALDGLYVVRTNLNETELDAEGTVVAYKRLSAVERAFRSLKTVDLKVRPVFHYKADRVRAHVLLCVLAYYVEWHMRQRLAPLLFDDEKPEEAIRTSVVAPVKVSKSAQLKARRKRNADDLPVHSFRTLINDLGTITKNQVQFKMEKAKPFEMITRPTKLQEEAFRLLGIKL